MIYIRKILFTFKMWLQIFLSLIILAALSFYNSCIVRPQKIRKWYINTLEGLGYSVYAYDFKPFSSSLHSVMASDTQNYQDACYNFKKNFPGKDFVLNNVLNNIAIQITNPQLIGIFLSAEQISKFPKQKSMVANVKRALGNGIAFSEGDEWKRKRKIINTVFNFNFIISNIPKMIRLCNENFQRVEGEENCQVKGQFHINILNLWSCIFSNVMMECFFGTARTYEKIDGKLTSVFLADLIIDITKQGLTPEGLLLGSKFLSFGLRSGDRDINRRIGLLREMGQKIIKDRLKELQKVKPKENYTDIVQALVFSKFMSTDDKKSKFENYDIIELLEEFCTFYTAGTDTSSHLLLMMIYYVVQNPKIQKRLRQQIDDIIHDDSDITQQNLKQLTYIDWIQNETTRVYGPGNGIFFRKATQDVQIKNFPIMKGTLLGVQPMGNHYSQKYFKDPFEFRPERWESECNQLLPYTFMGFSGGPRSCIGKHLTMLQTKVVLIKFMKRYEVIKLPKQNYKMESKFLYEPEPMKIFLKHKQEESD